MNVSNGEHCECDRNETQVCVMKEQSTAAMKTSLTPSIALDNAPVNLGKREAWEGG